MTVIVTNNTPDYDDDAAASFRVSTMFLMKNSPAL